MDFKTTSPNARPTKVATAYPNTPTNIPGTTKEDHFKEAAIAAAVVGPPERIYRHSRMTRPLPNTVNLQWLLNVAGEVTTNSSWRHRVMAS